MTRVTSPPASSGVRRQCLYCAAREHSPCGGVRDLRQLQALDGAHNLPRRIEDGTTLVAEGETTPSVYTVLHGWIALLDLLADGRRVILHFALPGDVIPLELLGPRSARSAVAIGEATVCSFSHARHQRLLVEDPQYAKRYHAAVARELHFAYDHFAEVVVSGAAERVLRLLWELGVRTLRRRPASGERVRAPLTQVQIGLATGLTAVHVSRTLRQLREQGLLEFSGHAVAFLDAAGVERLAGVSEDTLAMWRGAEA